MNGQLYDELDIADAERIASRNLCASCWQGLTVQRSDKGQRLWKVICLHCGDDRGFVSADYVERRRNEDHWDAYEAKKNLASALGIEPSKPVDVDKVIKDLWPE